MNHSPIERLESRIAPAAVFSFQEPDGDHVKIRVSKGTDEELAQSVEFRDGWLDLLELSDEDFWGANVSITAEEGTATIGTIAGRSFHRVHVEGSLGDIIVRPLLPGVALGKLECNSLGDAPFRPDGEKAGSSYLGGPARQITVDLLQGTLICDEDVRSISLGELAEDSEVTFVGKVGSLTFEGDFGGTVTIVDKMKDLRIRGDVAQGEIYLAGGQIRSVGIAGSLFGGQISGSGNLHSVHIHGGMYVTDVTAGGIRIDGDIGTFRVDHDVIGQPTPPELTPVPLIGAGYLYGQVTGSGKINHLAVGGSVIHAAIVAGLHIGDVRIHGDAYHLDLSAGDSTFELYNSGAPNQASRWVSIGRITIGGDLIESSLSARGDLSAKLGQLEVRGNVARSDVDFWAISSVHFHRSASDFAIDSIGISSIVISGPRVSEGYIYCYELYRLQIGDRAMPLIPGRGNDFEEFEGVFVWEQ